MAKRTKKLPRKANGKAGEKLASLAKAIASLAARVDKIEERWHVPAQDPQPAQEPQASATA